MQRDAHGTDAPPVEDGRIQIFLIDPSPAMRVGLRAILESSGSFHVIGEAANASSGLAGVLALRPTITLVAQELVDGGSLMADEGSLMTELHEQQSPTICLVVTDDDSADSFFRAIEAGAGGCIRRDADPFEVTSACRHAVQGYSLVSSRLVHRMHGHDETSGAPFHMLTEQERRVLERIAQGKSNREIANDLCLSEKTIRNYVSRMLAKLGVRNRTEAAAYHLQHQPRNRRPPGADPGRLDISIPESPPVDGRSTLGV